MRLKDLTIEVDGIALKGDLPPLELVGRLEDYCICTVFRHSERRQEESCCRRHHLAKCFGLCCFILFGGGGGG